VATTIDSTAERTEDVQGVHERFSVASMTTMATSAFGPADRLAIAIPQRMTMAATRMAISVVLLVIVECDDVLVDVVHQSVVSMAQTAATSSMSLCDHRFASRLTVAFLRAERSAV
jgi:hypothetical protein